MTPLVMVIEDNANIRSLLVEVLAEGGYAVLPFDTGAGAVEALRAARPAALILDLKLGPPLSGWEILAQLEQDSTVGSVPTLVCSGDALALREQSPQLLAHGYGVLAKPFHIDDLLHWLHTHCPPTVD
jgi:two-component system, OmpR family, phosphate regulon response regulator PhoB